MKRRRRGVVLALACLLGVFAGCGPAPRDVAVGNPAPADEKTPPPPLFREVEDSGIDFTYRNGEEAGQLSILESLGGGVALIDYDGDGLLHVFVTGGGDFTGPDNKAIVGRPCRLYHNLGSFKFEDVTDKVGLKDYPWFYTHGAAVADYDRDGWPDLLVTGWGRVALFHNEPVDPNDPAKGRKFVDVAEKSGLTGITWATGAAWADLDGDGYPDLYIDQYVDWSWDNNPRCQFDGKTWNTCTPGQFRGLPHKLFANNRNGTFREVGAEAGLRGGGPAESKGLGVLAVDVNDDGRPDLYVANDTVYSYLYINKCTPGHFCFEEVGVRSGTAGDDRGNPDGSMGVDAGDYDGSGRPSIWVTNYVNEQPALYHNDCKPGLVLFTHSTSKSGINAIGQKHVGWGTAFLDLDHHGWEDLFIANGHVLRYSTERDCPRRQRPVLLRNVGGEFKDVSARGGSYFEKEHLARGVGFGDLDNDGRTDIVVSHVNEPVSVLQNMAPVDGKHWLGVELVGKGHADVVGAMVRLEVGGRAQTRFAKGGGSYLSSNDRRCVFGLAETDKIDRLTVTWPNREVQAWETALLPVDQYYRLVQGQKDPEKARGE